MSDSSGNIPDNHRPMALEKNIIPEKEWGAHPEIPQEYKNFIEGEYCTAIGFHPDLGYFIIASGQGPFVVTSQRGTYSKFNHKIMNNY